MSNYALRRYAWLYAIFVLFLLYLLFSIALCGFSKAFVFSIITTVFSCTFMHRCWLQWLSLLVLPWWRHSKLTFRTNAIGRTVASTAERTWPTTTNSSPRSDSLLQVAGGWVQGCSHKREVGGRNDEVGYARHSTIWNIKRNCRRVCCPPSCPPHNTLVRFDCWGWKDRSN